MKAVMYGAGNIGRGFIGARLSESGYDVVFIDVNTELVNLLNDRGGYPVRYVEGSGSTDILIENVSAIDGNKTEEVVKAIADADVLATAVGANILKFIAPNIAAGFHARFAATDRPLDIIICENLMDVDLYLTELIKSVLPDDEHELFEKRVGMVEASIGRMVPVQTQEMQDGDPLRVCVESYGYLPVDKAAFKGEIPNIKNLVPFEPFGFYLKRKLYIHNLGHAVCAYLGLYEGLEYIYEAIGNADIKLIVQNTMFESAFALSNKYGIELKEIILHIQDLLSRFSNAALKDTCYRVGNDTKRKLAASDRLVGAATFCIEEGVKPIYISFGIAAALYRHAEENKLALDEQTASEILRELSGIEKGSEIGTLVLRAYDLFVSAKDIPEIRFTAEKVFTEQKPDIV